MYRRKQVETAQVIEVRDQPFYYVKTWKRHPITNAWLPKALACVQPGQVLVAVHDPATGKQAFAIYENMAAVHVDFEIDDDPATVEPIWPSGLPTITIGPSPRPRGVERQRPPRASVNDYPQHDASVVIDPPAYLQQPSAPKTHGLAHSSDPFS